MRRFHGHQVSSLPILGIFFFFNILSCLFNISNFHFYVSYTAASKQNQAFIYLANYLAKGKVSCAGPPQFGVQWPVDPAKGRCNFCNKTFVTQHSFSTKPLPPKPLNYLFESTQNYFYCTFTLKKKKLIKSRDFGLSRCLRIQTETLVEQILMDSEVKENWGQHD